MAFRRLMAWGTLWGAIVLVFLLMGLSFHVLEMLGWVKEGGLVAGIAALAAGIFRPVESEGTVDEIRGYTLGSIPFGLVLGVFWGIEHGLRTWLWISYLTGLGVSMLLMLPATYLLAKATALLLSDP